jgi:hypothetical protein
MPFENAFHEKKPIEMIAPPSKGRKTIFNKLLSHKKATPEDVIRGSPRDIKILGRLEMLQELAWLITFDEAYPPTDEAVISEHFNRLKIHLKPGGTGKGMRNTFLHILEDGVMPFVLDIELGRENLVTLRAV